MFDRFFSYFYNLFNLDLSEEINNPEKEDNERFEVAEENSIARKEILEKIANNFIEMHLKHEIIKDGKHTIRKNYDCIGVAITTARIYAEETAEYLVADDDALQSYLDKCQPEFIPGIIGAMYNMFAMTDMEHMGERVAFEDLQAGDWIIWQKEGAEWHGHIVTVLDTMLKIKVLNGSTNGYSSIKEYDNFKEKDKYYQRKFNYKPAFFVRPNFEDKNV